MKQIINKFKDGIIMGFGIIFIVFLSGVTYASYIWVTQSDVVSGDTLSKDSWNEMINNQNYLKQEIENSIPSGAIMMFNTTCPTGFTRISAIDDKFIRAGASYGVTGGSNNTPSHAHTDSFAVSNHSLTSSQIPSHTHSVNPPSTTSSSNGTHAHSIYGGYRSAGGSSGDLRGAGGVAGVSSNSAGSHTHTTDIPSFTSGSAGGSASHNHGLSGEVLSSGGVTGGNMPEYVTIVMCLKD